MAVVGAGTTGSLSAHTTAAGWFASPHSGSIDRRWPNHPIALLWSTIFDRLLAVPPSKPERYTARICWSTNGWRFPTGESPHLERGGYVVDAGFGHEEWLFNFAWLVDGFHYGFLQPVSSSFKKVAGKTIDVLLYTIGPGGIRCYAGEISNCEALQPDQATEAMKAYKKRGWLKSMAHQVDQVEGKAEYILNASNAMDLFNVRFRPEHVDIYDPLVAVGQMDAVRQRQRYTLAAADAEIKEQWLSRKGTTAPPLIRTITRKGTPGTTFDPFHKILQADLFPLLKGRYGKENVILERNNVDITIIDGEKTILIEIKTNSTPRAAIREAIGQLLEYAYCRPQAGARALELVVIAPGKLDEPADEYIQRLRTKFSIPISYCSHSEGDPIPELFGKS
jgi:hypothetical protein